MELTESFCDWSLFLSSEIDTPNIDFVVNFNVFIFFILFGLVPGSVLARNSIPILHSCAVMVKIAEMDYTGANSIFLR